MAKMSQVKARAVKLRTGALFGRPVDPDVVASALRATKAGPMGVGMGIPAAAETGSALSLGKGLNMAEELGAIGGKAAGAGSKLLKGATGLPGMIGLLLGGLMADQLVGARNEDLGIQTQIAGTQAMSEQTGNPKNYYYSAMRPVAEARAKAAEDILMEQISGRPRLARDEILT